jgi:hypothetical protein
MLKLAFHFKPIKTEADADRHMEGILWLAKMLKPDLWIIWGPGTGEIFNFRDFTHLYPEHPFDYGRLYRKTVSQVERNMPVVLKK